MHSKLLYTATMSLDGFIAGAGGDMSWLAKHMVPNPVVEELTAGTGSMIVGRRTYEGDDPNAGKEGEGEAFGGGWDGMQFVVTHRPPAADVPGVTFVTDLADAVDRARSAADGKYVNVLGADIARQCIELGVLDDIMIVVVPVLLGDGTRLFDFPGGTEVHLVQTRVTEVSGETNLWFTVSRS